MLTTILKVTLPQKKCVTSISTIVSAPTISSVNVWQEDDETLNHYPGISLKKFLNFNENCFAFMYYTGSASDPTIATINPVTKVFGEYEVITLPTYSPTPVVGTSKLYFYGGKLRSNSTYSNRLFEYDPVTKVVTEKGTGSGTARWDGCGCQIGNKILNFSGYNGSYVAAFTEYDLDTNTFTNRPTTPAARMGGSMITFNGLGYLVGATGIGSDVEARKIWSYSTTTNTWTNTTHVLPADMDLGSQWVIINNELYLFSTSETSSDVVPNMYKYDPGTGLTKVFGEGLTPALSANNLGIIKALGYMNGQIWAFGYLMSWYNGQPASDFYGFVDLANNSVIYDSYPVGVLRHEIRTTPIQTNRPDDPELVRFKLFGVGEGIPADPGYVIVETPFTEKLRIEDPYVYYTLTQPFTIPTDSLISYQIAYKSVNSEWGPWSNRYYRYGGEVG